MSSGAPDGLPGGEVVQGVSEKKISSSFRRRLAQVVRIILIVLVVLAAVWQLWNNWPDVARTIAEMEWQRTALSLLAAIVGIGFSTLSWQVLLDDLGPPIGVGRGAQILLVGSLGKYLPGSIWAYVLQIELGRKAGLAGARVFAATMFSIVVMVVAALLAGSLAIPVLVSQNSLLGWVPWLYLLLPFALILLAPPVLTRIVRFGFKVLRRPRPDHPVTLRVVISSVAFALGAYFSFGGHLWLLAGFDSIGSAMSAFALCVGTMGVAMLAGLVFFLLPSGVGAREFVIIVALSPLVGVGAATAYAAVSRVIFIVADLATAGSAAGLAVLARRRLGKFQGESDMPE